MNTKMHLMLIASMAAPALAGGSGLILDDFDADPNDDAGGVRDVFFSTYDDPFNQGGTFNIDTASSFGSDVGAAILNSGAGAEQQVVLTYDDNGGGLNINSTSLGWVGFEFDFAFVDQDFEAVIRLNTFAGSGTTLAQEAFQISANTGDQTVSVLFADFDTVGNAFDFSDVDSITVTLNPNRSGTPALNFILTEFRATVPTPGSVAMLGLGGLVAMRRRR